MYNDFMRQESTAQTRRQDPDHIPDGCTFYLPKHIVAGVLQAHGKDVDTAAHHFKRAGDKHYTATVDKGAQLRAVQRLTGKGVSYADQVCVRVHACACVRLRVHACVRAHVCVRASALMCTWHILYAQVYMWARRDLCTQLCTMSLCATGGGGEDIRGVGRKWYLLRRY
eukprot:GHVU01031335.1.p2 GENE.GHVU01031335.1~~GHVU01031335.1.p2  ORF type:complete len:169 (-),score=12.65 GHVU01031335.1:1079-1585(-)